MKQIIKLSLFTFLLSSSLGAQTAQAQFQLPIKLPGGTPAVDNRQQIQFDRNIQETQAKIQKWDEWLKSVATSPRRVLETNSKPGGYDDLVRWTFTPPWPGLKDHAQYPAVCSEIKALRTRIAKVGVYIPEWRYWQYDGLQPNDNQLKYIQSIEDKFNSMRGSTGISDKVEEQLKFVTDVVKRPEMESDPVLKHFRDELVKPQLAGLTWRNAVIKINYLEGAQKSLRDDFARSWGSGCLQPCKSRLTGEAAKLISYIDQVKGAGFDLNAHQIMSDPREPLSPSWTLTQLRAELGKLQSKK